MDRSREPLIRVTLAGDVKDEDFDRCLEESDAVIAQQRPYVLIYEADELAAVSARQRRLQVDWIKRNRKALSELCKGAAFCFQSRIMQGAQTAVLWMAPLPFEHVFRSEYHEASKWARGGWLAVTEVTIATVP